MIIGFAGLIIAVVLFSLFALLMTRHVIQVADSISVPEFEEKIKAGWQVVDVRTQAEFEQGHIPDALLVDYYQPDFQEKIMNLDKSKKYLLYCRSGGRSRKARDMMKNNGFENVTDLLGGYIAWSNSHK